MTASQALDLLNTVLLVPFCRTALDFVWGAADTAWMMALKRGFLLLPLLALVLGYWATVFCVPTLIVRNKRRAFFNAVLATWWDLGRSVFLFWGGVFQFAFTLTVAVFSLARVLVVGLWLACQDIILIPFRLIGNLGNNLMNPSIPWIAVALTLGWCTFEAIIFTYVMSPLVMDTLSNLTGNQLTNATIRIPLFLFMIFISLGSYSVLSTWTAALKSRDVAAIIKIGAIEAVALFVEVVFLYREFVDALVPWFAQHTSGNFDLGIVGTLGIAGATWFGIRSLSWFLFASRGTPTLMAVIQGTGVSRARREKVNPLQGAFSLTQGLIDRLKADGAWVQAETEKVVGSFILPPLQIVAGALNFCSLLFTSRHLFELPFRALSELKNAKELMNQKLPDNVRRIRKAA